jgi:preprotein translocase subunit YajC
MNLILLDAAPAQTAGGSGNMSFLVMMALIFVVMYIFMIRPQQKKAKDLKKFREGLEKGAKIVTIGGIYGTVCEIKDNYILVEVDNNVRLRFDRNSVLKDPADLPQK